MALGVVGAVIGGVTSGGNLGAIQTGWAIGTLVGGFVDSSKQKPQQVGRLTDLKITTSQYGTGIPWLWGTHRVGTSLVWWSDLRETSRKQGSKLSGQRQQVFSYSTDLLLLLCRGPVTSISKVYGEDLTLWDSTGGGSNESQLITVGTNSAGQFKVNFRGYQSAALAYNSAAGLIQSTLEALVSIGPGNISVSGGTGPWTATFQGTLAGQNVPRMDMDEFTLSGGSGEGITTLLQGGTPYDISFLLGDYEQSVITEIDDQQFAATGDHVPAYRGRAGIFINELNVGPWGNRLPNLSALVTRDSVYEDWVRADGPVVHYRFEVTPGKLADSGVHRYDLENLNGTTVQVVTSHGTGLQVASGTSENARTVGVVNSLFGQQLTVEGWFRYKGGSPTLNGGFRVKYRTPYDTWHLNVEPNVFLSTLVVQWIVDETGIGDYETIHQYSFARDTAEHHVVVSYDRANGASNLYVDGVLVDTQTPLTTFGEGSANSQLYLKCADNISGDEIAVYDKALTAAEVADHFNGRGVQLKDVLSELMVEVGIAGDEYDVREATQAIDGLLIPDRTETRTVIEGVCQAFFTDLVEVDGRLKAVPRGGDPVLTIDELDLGCELVEAGSDLEPKAIVNTRRIQELELPFSVDFTYISATNGYQQSSQRALRYTKSHLQEAVTVNVPLVFTEDEARLVAERMLYQAWIERETFEISLPISYLGLVPGDVVLLPVGASLLRCRIVEATIGLPGAVNCRLVLDDAAVLTQVAPGGELGDGVDFQVPVTTTALVAWNGNAGRNEDATSVGLYVAANGAAPGNWDGAVLYLSRDGGASYQELTALTDPASFGTATSVLAAFTTTGLFDDTNTVDITLTSGTDNPPVSMADADVLAGANGAIIGDEMIQYGTVTPLGGDSYQLSHLLRGRRGTDTFWEEHVTGERAVLDNGGITRVELPTGLASGTPVLVKALGTGQTLEDVSATTVYVFGREVRAWSVVDVAGSRDGGLNLTVSFNRRSRLAADSQPAQFVPLDYLLERYTTLILPVAGTTITAITQAAQGVVTAAGHGLIAGDAAYFSGIVGMLHLNGQAVRVVSVSGTSFTINLDTRGYQPYLSGGAVRKPLRTISTTTNSVPYSASDQTTDFGSPQPSISIAIYQLDDSGRNGYPTIATV